MPVFDILGHRSAAKINPHAEVLLHPLPRVLQVRRQPLVEVADRSVAGIVLREVVNALRRFKVANVRALRQIDQ